MHRHSQTYVRICTHMYINTYLHIYTYKYATPESTAEDGHKRGPVVCAAANFEFACEIGNTAKIHIHMYVRVYVLICVHI